MKVFFLCRNGKKQLGGLKWSAVLATGALRSVGDEVVTHNVKLMPDTIPEGTDLVWVYGEIDHIPEIAKMTRALNIPLIVNSTHDDRNVRRQAIGKRSRAWGAGVYQVVFTDAAAASYKSTPVVMVPNLFKADFTEYPGFAERKGICIGDAKKLLTPRLIGGLNARDALQAIAEAFPDVEVWGYEQYRTQGTDIPDTLRVAPFQAQLPRWLSQFRIFVSFARHETFAMVPLEAQAVGTPVLYRPMPQSLSAYIGPSAVSFRTIDELIAALREAYFNETIWDQLSEAGRWNARSRSPDVMGALLHLALSRIIHRHKEDGR